MLSAITKRTIDAEECFTNLGSLDGSDKTGKEKAFE